MKEDAGEAGMLLGEKNLKESIVSERSCSTKMKCVHKTPEGEYVVAGKDF